MISHYSLYVSFVSFCILFWNECCLHYTNAICVLMNVNHQYGRPPLPGNLRVACDSAPPRVQKYSEKTTISWFLGLARTGSRQDCMHTFAADIGGRQNVRANHQVSAAREKLLHLCSGIRKSTMNTNTHAQLHARTHTHTQTHTYTQSACALMSITRPGMTAIL